MDIWYKRYSQEDSNWGTETRLTTDTAYDYGPAALQDPTGDLWVFWQSDRSRNRDIWYKRYSWADSDWGTETRLTTDIGYDYDPVALQDPTGDLWVFWESYRSENMDIWYKRYSQADSNWGTETRLTTDTANDYNPVALQDPTGDLWVFWQSYRSGSLDIWYKKLILEI
jgi:RPA family protein